jgi:hypothetical protein
MGPEDNLAKKRKSVTSYVDSKICRGRDWEENQICGHATCLAARALRKSATKISAQQAENRSLYPALDTELLFLTLEMESATWLNQNWPTSKTDEKHLPSTEQWEPKQGSELKSEADRRRPDWKSNRSEPNHRWRLQELTQKTSPSFTVARPDLNLNVTTKIDQAKQKKNTRALERNQRANNTGSSCANKENNSALTGRTGNPEHVEVTQSLRPENERDQEILDMTKI